MTTLVLSTLGTVRDEGYCLDKRAMVLTEAESVAIEVEVKSLRHDLAAAKRETATALESQAVCLTSPAPVCDCNEWTASIIGAGLGVVGCSTLWIGSRP